jgi:hypothetical protein
MFPDRVSFRGSEPPGWGVPGWFPAAAQLRQSQIGGELPSAEPNQAAAMSGVAGQGDGVSSDLGGVTGAQPLADQHTGTGEASEEILLTRRARGGGADGPLECDPRWFSPSAPQRLLLLGASRAASCGPVTGSRAPQSVAFLGDLKDKIKAMVEDGGFPKALGDWADHVRLYGNAGAHPDKFGDVSLEEAAEVGRLTYSIIEALYVLPENISRRQAQRRQ